jgi:hypothetical protein
MTDEMHEDPELGPEEKQVSLVTTKDSDTFRVHSEVTSITRYLLNHPAVEVENTREVEGSIVACTAVVPHGLVKLQGKPRKSDAFAQIASGGELQSRE